MVSSLPGVQSAKPASRTWQGQCHGIARSAQICLCNYNVQPHFLTFITKHFVKIRRGMHSKWLHDVTFLLHHICCHFFNVDISPDGRVCLSTCLPHKPAVTRNPMLTPALSKASSQALLHYQLKGRGSFTYLYTPACLLKNVTWFRAVLFALT